jgi:hypothetical protein
VHRHPRHIEAHSKPLFARDVGDALAEGVAARRAVRLRSFEADLTPDRPMRAM